MAKMINQEDAEKMTVNFLIIVVDRFLEIVFHIHALIKNTYNLNRV